MKENGIGGANTKTGLVFEGKTDLQTFLCGQNGYSCQTNNSGWVDVFYNKEQVASNTYKIYIKILFCICT